MVLEQLDIHMKKKSRHRLCSQKFNSKWITGLNVKHETIPRR